MYQGMMLSSKENDLGLFNVCLTESLTKPEQRHSASVFGLQMCLTGERIYDENPSDLWS